MIAAMPSNALVANTLVLAAETATDMMGRDLVSLRANARVSEALELFTTRGISAAPVIDEAGHPIGVLSRSDILIHNRETAELLRPRPEYFFAAELPAGKGKPSQAQLDSFEKTFVRDLMTPAVFSVCPDTPASKVVSEMLALRVHRLFVVDPSGVLVGVVSALDILRHLRP